jgi:lipopolysaccharide biosynthesis protein
MLTRFGDSSDEVVSNWTFTPSKVGWRLFGKRIVTFFRRGRRMPKHIVIKELSPRPQWICYVMFSADCNISPAQRFTLNALKSSYAGLMIVIISPSANDIPHELVDLADALYWKENSGWDFPAFAIALNAIGRLSPGADVFVLNDSVYGPFCDIGRFFREAKWDLTGITAGGQIENHIQSYAFVLKAVTQPRMRKLNRVLFKHVSFHDQREVVVMQESRFARVAARSLTVGAWWYSNSTKFDLTLHQPFNLIDIGCPFIKKSLFGKHKGLQDPKALEEVLCRMNHPTE